MDPSSAVGAGVAGAAAVGVAAAATVATVVSAANSASLSAVITPVAVGSDLPMLGLSQPSSVAPAAATTAVGRPFGRDTSTAKGLADPLLAAVPPVPAAAAAVDAQAINITGDHS